MIKNIFTSAALVCTFTAFAITPQETPVSIEGHVFTAELEPNTFTVYKFTKK